MKAFLRDSFRKGFPGFIAISLSICVFFLIYRFNHLNAGIGHLVNILMPFVYGGVIAYLLKTPYNFFEKKMIKLLSEKRTGLAKLLSVLIVLIIALALIVILLILIIPALADSLVSIANEIPGVIDSLTKWLEEIDPDGTGIGGTIISALDTAEKNVVPWLQDNILSNISETLSGALSTVTGILGLLYNILIGIIICVYVLLSKDTFGRQAKMLVYSIFSRKVADWIVDEFVFIDKTFNGFFAGKILDSAIVGLICFAFCVILHLTLGLSNVVLISVVIGVTNIIPFFGPYIGGIPCAILALMDGPLTCIVFALFIIVLQMVDGNFIGPKCLSSGVGLAGFWVLFAITLFGGLLGFVGVLVGVPIFAVIYDLIRKCVHAGLKKNGITELPVRTQDPVPEEKKSAEEAQA